jgi:enterochelin esterase-like enzyme
VSSTFIAASYSQVFHNLAALSPALWVIGNSEALGDPAKAAGVRKMEAPIQSIVTCGGETGISCPALPLKIFLSFGEPNWDIGDLNSEALALRGQGYPVMALQLREGHAWSAWRGILDEMLVYFFSK